MTIVIVGLAAMVVALGAVAVLALRHAHKTSLFYQRELHKMVGSMEEHIKLVALVNETWGNFSQNVLASLIGMMGAMNEQTQVMKVMVRPNE